MNEPDRWFYSIHANGTQGLIVDAEGFTVLEMRSHWVSLQPLLAQLCEAHNRQQRSQPSRP